MFLKSFTMSPPYDCMKLWHCKDEKKRLNEGFIGMSVRTEKSQGSPTELETFLVSILKHYCSFSRVFPGLPQDLNRFHPKKSIIFNFSMNIFRKFGKISRKLQEDISRQLPPYFLLELPFPFKRGILKIL
jgi:hypothetical protein